MSTEPMPTDTLDEITRDSNSQPARALEVLPESTAPSAGLQADSTATSNHGSAPSVFTSLRTATRAVTQFYDLVLAPAGLKATQFIILQAIHDRGEIAQCDFARDYGIAVPTLSRRFASLRKKEYIQIRRGTRHGERIYSFTEKGEAAYRNAVSYWERAQHRLQMSLGDADWNAMLRLSERTRQAALEAEKLRTENHRPASPRSDSMPASA